MRTPLMAVMLFAVMSFAAALHADDAALAVSIPINLSSDPPSNGAPDGALAYLGATSNFHVVITNVSDKPQKVWDDGDHLSFIFTDTHGKKWTCDHMPMPETKPRGVWWLLEPHDTLVIDVDFKDGNWHGWRGFPVPEGEFFLGTIQAVFIGVNDAPANGLWTGRVVSKPKLIRFYPAKPH